MILTFTPEKHEYLSPEHQIDWISVTSLASYFKHPFDANKQSIKSTKNKKSKWYGMDPNLVKDLWNKEGKRATDLGNWWHDQREKDIGEFETIERHGVTIPIIRPTFKDGIKHAPSQKLINGIYPEHFVYLQSAGICGQSDRVEVINNKVYIGDYKTNKELKLKGYTKYDGTIDMMLEPLAHLEDCHLTHYALQLSLYMYIILKHNPEFKPGDMILDHVLFEVESMNEQGYPIYKIDNSGNFVVKEVKHYPVPYYKSEVITMLNYLRDNRERVKLKIH